LEEYFVLHLEYFQWFDVQMSPISGIYIHPPSQWTVEIYLILRLVLHIQNILYKYHR